MVWSLNLKGFFELLQFFSQLHQTPYHIFHLCRFVWILLFFLFCTF